MKILMLLSKFQILYNLVSVVLIAATQQNYSRHGLFWSGKPSIFSNIVDNDSWQAINNAYVITNWKHAASVLVSYDIIVEGFRESDFSLLPRESFSDILQTRCLIDGIPYRFSCSYATTYAEEQLSVAKLSSTFVVELGTGSHNISVQWKKSGASVKQWSISQNGIDSGGSVTVLANPTIIAHVNEGNDMFLFKTNVWTDLTKPLTFLLEETTTITIGYSFSAQPQIMKFIKDRGYEYITTRLVIDGVAIADGGVTKGTSCWKPSVLVMKAAMSINLAAGTHTVTLQWKKFGTVFTWGSNPSFLDGFANARNLYVLSEKVETAQKLLSGNNLYHADTSNNSWITVANCVQQFYLTKESAVLFTYALPVTQYMNPNFDSNVWLPLTRIDARLVVDGLPYMYTGGSTLLADSTIIDNLYGTLPLVLPTGSHSVTLQWRSENGYNWTTLNGISNGFLGANSLLAYISSEDSEPVFTAPDVVYGLEGDTFTIAGIRIVDVDTDLEDGMKVMVNITSIFGFLTFPEAPLLSHTIEHIHGNNFSTYLLQDTVSNVNAALANVQYFAPLTKYGNDTLLLKVDDVNDVLLGLDEAATATITVVVIPLENIFSLSDLDTQAFALDNVTSAPFSLAEIVPQDVDVFITLFEIQLAVSCGTMTVSGFPYANRSVEFLSGGLENVTLIDMKGLLSEMQDAVNSLQFYPDTACSGLYRNDFMSVKVINTNNVTQTVETFLPLHILTENIAPDISSLNVNTPRLLLSGIVSGGSSSLSAFSDDRQTGSHWTVSPTDFLGGAAQSVNETQDLVRMSTNTSNLSFLKHKFFDYAVSVQYNAVGMEIVSQSYLFDGLQSSLLVKMGANLNDVSDVLCNVGNHSFTAELLSASVVRCNITVNKNANSEDVNAREVQWLHVSYNSASGQSFSSVFVPLTLSPSPHIMSVFPMSFYRNGRIPLRITCSTVSVVQYCVFGSDIVVASFRDGNGLVYCRTPDLTNYTDSSISLKVGSGDLQYLSDEVILNVLTVGLISDVRLENGHFGDQALQIVVKGNLTATEIDVVNEIVCRVNDIAYSALYVSENKVVCALDANGMNYLTDDLIVTLQFDSQLTNTFILSRLSHESISNSSFFSTPSTLSVLDSVPHYLLDYDTVSIYGTQFQDSVSSLSCVFKSEMHNLSVLTSAAYVSDFGLKCFLPQQLERSQLASVTVKSVDDSMTMSIVNISVQLVELTSIAPLRGSVRGGEAIVITGTGFDNSTEYSCLIDRVRVSAMFVTNESLVCYAPPHHIATVVVRLLVGESLVMSTNENKFYFTYHSDSKIHSISPDTGFIFRDETVTVFGIGFSALQTVVNIVACRFGGEFSIATVVNDTALICSVPIRDAEGLVVFSVIIDGKEQMSGEVVFTYIHSDAHQPVLSGGGEILSVSETSNFYYPNSFNATATFVKIALAECAVSEKSTLCLSLTAQSDCYSYNSCGMESVTIETPSNFTVREFGGTSVYFTVKEVLPFLEFDTLCLFGTHESPLIRISESDFECIAPALTAGDVTFSLIHSNGAVISNSMTFAYASTLSVSLVLPRALPVDTQVMSTVYGKGFVRDVMNATNCKFDGVVTSAMVQSDNTLRCYNAVSKQAKVVPVAVNYGDIDGSKIGHISYFAIPMITSCLPISGSHGDYISLKGAAFSQNSFTQCLFGSIRAPARVVNSNTVECRVPEVNSTVTVQMGVLVEGFRFLSPQLVFTLKPVIDVTTVKSVALTGEDGNDMLVIHGVGFAFTDVLKCNLGIIETSAQFVNASTVACGKVVNITSSSLDLQISSHETFNVVMDKAVQKTISDASAQFNYGQLSTTYKLSPSFGPVAGGTEVVVFGSSFESAAGELVCWFGESQVVALVLNDTALVCETPTALTAGAVSVNVSSLESGANATKTMTFTYVSQTTIIDINPSQVIVRGGTAVNFTTSDSDSFKFLTCLFDTVKVSSVWIASDVWQCVAPPHSAGMVDLSIYQGDALESCVIYSTKVEYVSAPSVASLYPLSGSPFGGDVVDVFGDGFISFNTSTSLYQCLFGDVLVEAAVVSEHHLQCSIPPSSIVGGVNLSIKLNGLVISEGVHFLYESNDLTLPQSPDLPGDEEEEIALSALIGSNDVYISGIYPTSNSGTVMSVISVVGFGFDQYKNTTETLTCRFGDRFVSSAKIVSNTVILCSEPNITVNGLYFVSVVLASSEKTIRSTNVYYRHVTSLIATGMTPNFGPVAGGTEVVVFGSSFESAAGELVFWFGESQVVALILNDTALVCETPTALTAGAVSVSVSVDDFTVNLSETMTFMYVAVDETILVVDSTSTLPSLIISEHAVSSLSSSSMHYNVSAQLMPSVIPIGRITSLKITGLVFRHSNNYTCVFGTEDHSPAVVVSEHEIECLSPSINYPVDTYLTLYVSNELMTGVNLSLSVQNNPHLVSGLLDKKSGMTSAASLTLVGVNIASNLNWKCVQNELLFNAIVVSKDKIICDVPHYERDSSFLLNVSLRSQDGFRQSNSITIDMSNAATSSTAEEAFKYEYTDVGNAQCSIRQWDVRNSLLEQDLYAPREVLIDTDNRDNDVHLLSSSISSKLKISRHSSIISASASLHCAYTEQGVSSDDCFDVVLSSSPLTESVTSQSLSSYVKELSQFSDVGTTTVLVDSDNRVLLSTSIAFINASTGAQISVYGKGFSNSSQCVVDGTLLTTEFVSAQHVTCFIPSVRETNNRIVELTVRNDEHFFLNSLSLSYVFETVLHTASLQAVGNSTDSTSLDRRKTDLCVHDSILCNDEFFVTSEIVTAEDQFILSRQKSEFLTESTDALIGNVSSRRSSVIEALFDNFVDDDAQHGSAVYFAYPPVINIGNRQDVTIHVFGLNLDTDDLMQQCAAESDMHNCRVISTSEVVYFVSFASLAHRSVLEDIQLLSLNITLGVDSAVTLCKYAIKCISTSLSLTSTAELQSTTFENRLTGSVLGGFALHTTSNSVDLGCSFSFIDKLSHVSVAVNDYVLCVVPAVSREGFADISILSLFSGHVESHSSGLYYQFHQEPETLFRYNYIDNQVLDVSGYIGEEYSLMNVDAVTIASSSSDGSNSGSCSLRSSKEIICESIWPGLVPHFDILNASIIQSHADKEACVKNYYFEQIIHDSTIDEYSLVLESTVFPYTLSQHCERETTVVVSMSTVYHSVRYSCYLSGQFIGHGKYLDNKRVSCKVPATSPGVYNLTVANADSDSTTMFQTILARVVVQCTSFASSTYITRVLGRAKARGVNEIRFQGLGKTSTHANVQHMSCLIDDELISVTRSSDYDYSCFHALLPGTVKISLLQGKTELVVLRVCLTEVNIRKGVTLTANSNNSAECVDDSAKTPSDMAVEISRNIQYSAPQSGLLRGSTEVDILLQNMQPTSVLVCQFGNTSVHAFVTGTDRIICYSPSTYVAGNVSLSVRNQDGTNVWKGGWFVYHDIIRLKAVESSLIGKSNEMLLKIETYSKLNRNLQYFCRLDYSSYPAYIINHESLACKVLVGSLTTASVAIGSETESWSDSLPLHVRNSVLPASIYPSHGNKIGNSNITITFTSQPALTTPQCVFDSIRVNATVSSKNAFICTVPPSLYIGSVDVSLIDAHFSNDVAQYIGVYTYEETVNIFSVTPNVIRCGSSVQLLISGIHFVDTSDLSCRFDSDIYVGAKWLSESLLMCITPDDLFCTGLDLSLAVSNNGLDFTSSVNLSVSESDKIVSFAPNIAFTLGGTEVTFTSKRDLSSKFECRFGDMIPVTAMQTDSHSCVCVTPNSVPQGNFLMQLVDTLSEIVIFHDNFVFVSPPTVEVANSLLTVTSGTESTVVIVGANLRHIVAYQVRNSNGVVDGLISCDTALNDSQLMCAIVTYSEFDVLFLDVSVNNVDFIEHLVSIYVQPPTSVIMQKSQVLVSNTGGTDVLFVIEPIQNIFDIICIFFFGETVLYSQINQQNNNTLYCESPMLPMFTDVYLQIQRNNVTIYGPVEVLVTEDMRVRSISPLVASVGNYMLVELSFVNHIQINRLTQCMFQGVESIMKQVNSTLGLCSVYPTQIGQHELIVRVQGEYDKAVGNITVHNMTGTFRMSSDIIREYVASNITVTSSACDLPHSAYCAVSGRVSVISYVSGCEIVCSVTTYLSYTALKLSICVSSPCIEPVFSSVLNVVSSMALASAQNAFGSIPKASAQTLIRGTSFHNVDNLNCYYDLLQLPARVLSPNLLSCSTPSVSHKFDTFGVLQGDWEIPVSSDFKLLHQLPLTKITVSPTFVLETGGTSVLLRTQNVQSFQMFSCRFGHSIVSAVMLNQTLFRCISPALDVGTSELALSVDGVDISVGAVLTVVSVPVVTVLSQGSAIRVGLSQYLQRSSVECRINNIPIAESQLYAEDLIFIPPETTRLQNNKMNQELTLHLSGVEFYRSSLEVQSSCQIMSVSPLSTAADISSLLTLRVSECNGDEAFYKCCFGNLTTLAMRLSDDVWQCYTPTLIVSGGTSTLTVPVGLSDREGVCSYSKFNLTLNQKPLIAKMGLNMTGSTAGGSSIVVEFITPQLLDASIFCKLGLSIFLGTLIDTHRLLCVTPDPPSAMLPLEISFNGIDFISTDQFFTYEAIAPHLTPVSPTSVQPEVQLVSPTVFGSSSQATVTVHGRNYRRDSLCFLVSNQGYNLLDTTFETEGRLTCVLPIHEIGVAVLSVMTHDGVVASSNASISFVAESSVLGIVTPEFGPTNTLTLLTVFGNNLDSISGLYCVIGSDFSFATSVTSSSVQCMAPASLIPAKVNVRLANSNKEFLSGSGEFQYLSDAQVLSVLPKRGSQFTELKVTGTGFSKYIEYESFSCMIGEAVVETIFVSDTEMICVIPLLDKGIYSVTFETNGQHTLDSGVIFEYFELAKLTKLFPLSGPSMRGGTVISVYGSGFIDKVGIICVFDTTPVEATYLSPDMIQCISPPHRPELVNVTVISDGTKIHSTTDNLQFLYAPDVSVDKITPEFGYTSGEFPVFVFGSNFVNTTGLGCMFADMKSRGIFLSNTSMVCLAPSPIGRPELFDRTNVAVEVTINGLDYSDSGVKFAYSQPCDQGFFCPGMTRQLCPNGTYCPVNSRNFTICAPGTFQPKEGQTGCVLCPVGYICPDHGMSRPVNCPPGLICDIMGLRTSAVLCPSGHYCLNNTKASGASFFNLTDHIWSKDNVSGVVSFVPDNNHYNWSYQPWPFPAVGQSRSQHPPEGGCDGLVCFPGSTNILAEAPFPCPLGHYCRAGVGTQIPVPKNFSTPQRCFDGFYCPRGSVSPEGSGPCPNGYFCPTQQDAIKCPQGHYCPGVGNSFPIECYPGTYNPFEGKANCTVCPTGYICPGWGVLLPEPCPQGFVCMALGVSYPVVQCPQGYRCAEGTLTLDPSAPTKFKPVVCDEGEFCLGGVSNNIAIEWIPSQPFGKSHPQLCSEGTYCQSGAYLSSGSGLCFQGHYCPPNKPFPIETPVGNFASGLGSVAPTLCYPGTYAPLTAQVDCLLCPSGNTCTSYGTYIPSVCKAGTYRSQVDSVTCTQCPTGTYSYEVGSPDLSLCLPCPQGRICGVKQMTTLLLSAECPAGYICGYGTDRSSQFQHLTPAGFHTATESVPDVQYDSVCQPGYYCPRGTPTYLQFGGKCPVGYYCPQSTPAAISADVKCPILTTSLSSLDTLQGCRISEINVCDKSELDLTKPMEDITYYSSFSYSLMDDSDTIISFASSLSAVSPTGEIKVVRKIYPTNVSASSPFWVNDTVEAFRSCPLYGSGAGGDNIIIIGRNFRDTKLNYCKFRGCNSANLGEHPRRCKNQILSPTGFDLPTAGNVSRATFITRARYISSTRIECPTPEFLFDYDFAPDESIVKYKCDYVDGLGKYQAGGNYSYVRKCGTSDENCDNKPDKGYEFFTSLTFPCTAEEILDGKCADKPEPGYMFNPCMSGEVIVEVTNDGEHYSGGAELTGISILSTVRYLETDSTIYNNFKNFTVPATFAVYTYVYPDHFYKLANHSIMTMELKYCKLARYSEEAEREREQGWFLVQAQEAAHVHVDFSFLPSNLVYNEHYTLAIFMLPSRCTVEICSATRVRLSPEEFLPCRKPAALSYWFENSGVYNVKNNITIYALDDLIFKVEIHLLYGLYAAYEPLFQNTSIVRIAAPSRTANYVGMKMSETKTRQLSQYVSFEERRVTTQWFWCAVVYFTDTLVISQALNLPPTYSAYERGRALLMNNVSAENDEVPFVSDVYEDVQYGPNFWLMPASTSDNSKELLDAYFETFHDTTYDPISGYVFSLDTLLLGYLPYFSNCNTFDSYIPIWLLLEGKECALPDIYPKSWDRYKFPPLPDQDDVKFVGPFDFLEFPVADWCERSLSCHYEEILGTTDSTPRWFELSTSATLFQMIRYPLNYDQYTGRKGTHISQTDAGGGAVVDYYAASSGDNLISVMVDHTLGDLVPGCILLCYARAYLLTIQYYQLDLHNKKIILISLAGDQYDFDSTDTSYELQVSYQAMGFIDLILNFAFPLPIFIVMFITLGVATAFISFIGWGFCRATTLLQNPPQLKMFGMLALVVPPPLAGVTMAVILIWLLTALGNYFVNGMIFTDPNSPEVKERGEILDEYSLKYADIGTTISTEEFELARAGRIGSVFMIVGFCCFAAASKMYFPKEESKREREIAKKRTALAEKDEIWNPVLWKKANFIFTSIVFSCILVLVVEFSFWSLFGSEAFYSILVMFIIFGEVLTQLLEAQLQDIILVVPLNAGFNFVTQLVTFGSPDFLAFLLSYFLGFAMSGFQRVFQGFYIDTIFDALTYIADGVVSFLKRFVPRYMSGDNGAADKDGKEDKDYRKRDVDGVAETGEDAESVEPIIAYFADICSDTMILFYFPFFVYLLMQYRQQIQIPIIYGIRQSDMMIYLVFQLLMLVAQPVADVFNHAQCELFHGWKIYEYLVYSRYRFLQRETRWKGMENSLDECIEESLRKLDQMCFSSQYYIMLTAQVNGIIYVIIAFECWLRVGYSPFSDSGFFFLVAYMIAMYVLVEYAVIFLALRFKLYKIKHENTAWHLVQKEEDELDIPGWEDIKGASSEAYVMNQRITSETFRYKFLNYNRTWLINQLPQLLTPRTMRRSRPYLINQFARIINAKRDDISDDSENENKDKKFGPVALTAPSRNIIRWWLGKARRRLRLRSIVDPLIKRARGAQCEQCLSRKQLQIEYEVDVDAMSEMYDRTYPGDEEVDQVQWKSFWINNQRYHTICLACLTKRKEVASRNAMKGGDDSTFLDDDQEAYPDWGPVFLTASSKAMLLNWYRKAQRVRAGKRGTNRTKKVSKDISDDEGDDIPLSWIKELQNVTPATHAIAVKWMRTARAKLQRKAGKGVSTREADDENQATDTKETFLSGSKSKMMKK